METQTFLSAGTTFVSSTLAPYNLSTSAVIAVGTHPVYQDSISFLRFDLSSISAANASSAVLRLFVFEKEGAAPSPVVINRVTSDYDINTVTYNTRPAYVNTEITSEVSSDEVIKYIEIPVTTLVNQWLNGDFPNYGFALTNPDGTTSVLFGGKPVGASYEPQLVITYSSETPGKLTGIQAQLQRSPGTIIADGANVIFDSTLTDQSESISYNPATGEFTISKPDNYYISWWVTTDGSAGPVNMVFGLVADGTTIAVGNSPDVTGQVDGDGFLTVSNDPVTLTLVNQTGADVLYANIPVQANISIITVVSDSSV
ncbi:DNRLRE domain-containing protein [Anaerocolumna sedimenticola]|uniref:DNRLRE domain-containing protein n=1 Tax=Anaerocolumna sedimenticola TaxID=2696063 RepID=A0A6P1TUT5_9FIRM|nr:DNRLRE domain-containing protein [Anaerocolumna sedimenticola]QHQ63195.1 DNRLRE domain-containing protein [Anaerocolumna sedimenticola]